MTDDINGLAKVAYEAGVDPLLWAEKLVGELIDVHLEVMVAREADPKAFPGFPIELTLGALSRRILGDLLDAGWTPPGGHRG